jgi:dolichyl-phosphate-mannose--protein O-mannosyl transferase
VERAVRILRNPVFAIAAVTILAGAVRFANLSYPPTLVFDETYYAKDACIFLSEAPKDCGLKLANEQSWVHPPLGKWLIAGGEAIFGAQIDGPTKTPFGWRFSSAAAGTLTVTLTAILALLLTRSVLWAAIAGLLLATENLSFVMSRMSMLDIFLSLFVVAGYLCLALDRRWIDRQEPAPEPDVGAEGFQSLGPGAMAAQEFAVGDPALAEPRDVPSPLVRPWRLWAGLFLGAGTAVKWSGATALVGAILLSFIWEVTRRRRAGRPHPLWEATSQESFGILLSLVVAPILVYLSTYVVWLKDHDWSLSALWRNHTSIADFHWHLEAFKPDGKPTHPYQSRAWTWLFMGRPVSYYYEGGNGTAAEILGMGNPAIFWGSLIAVPTTIVLAWRRRDWTAWLVAAGFLVQFVPWLPVNRPIFLFYMVPVVPFMVLAAVVALRRLSENRTAPGLFATVAGLLVGISVALFAFFYPILVGTTLSTDAWKARIWFPSWV